MKIDGKPTEKVKKRTIELAGDSPKTCAAPDLQRVLGLGVFFCREKAMDENLERERFLSCQVPGISYHIIFMDTILENIESQSIVSQNMVMSQESHSNITSGHWDCSLSYEI